MKEWAPLRHFTALTLFGPLYLSIFLPIYFFLSLSLYFSPWRGTKNSLIRHRYTFLLPWCAWHDSVNHFLQRQESRVGKKLTRINDDLLLTHFLLRYQTQTFFSLSLSLLSDSQILLYVTYTTWKVVMGTKIIIMMMSNKKGMVREREREKMRGERRGKWKGSVKNDCQ